VPEAPTRWRRRKEARPNEIVAAALDSFVERGYAATRLEDVARRAGVTKGTLYLYFPNKAELFKAVVRAVLSPRLADMAGAMATLSASAFLERLVITVRDVAATPVGGLPKLILAESGNFPEIARFYYEEVVERGLNLIKGVLRRGVASGEFRPVDVDYVCYCVVGPMLLGVLWQRTMEPYAAAPLDYDRLCRTHLDILLAGLRPTEAAP